MEDNGKRKKEAIRCPRHRFNSERIRGELVAAMHLHNPVLSSIVDEKNGRRFTPSEVPRYVLPDRGS